MKDLFVSLIIFILLAFNVNANDIEVIELESVSKKEHYESENTKFYKKKYKNIDHKARKKFINDNLEAERLIEEAYFVIKELEHDSKNSFNVKSALKNARAILVFPNIINVGFLIGASSGTGILLAKNKYGQWSNPSFYDIKTISVGLQLGAGSSQVVMAIMNVRALKAIITNKIKVGVSIKSAIGSTGESVGYSTTSNLKQDILTFAHSKGLFLGVNLKGGSFSENKSLNRAFYRSRLANTKNIILKNLLSNNKANKIRNYLYNINN